MCIRDRDELVSIADITPTLIQELGVDLRQGDFDGENIASLIKGKGEPVHQYVYGAFTNCRIMGNRDRIFPIRSIRDQRYSLIFNPRLVYLNRNNAYSNNEISRYDNPGPVYRKSNLGLLLLGKNRWEVQEIIGEPNGRSLNQRNEHVWDYRRAAIDDTSGEIFEWSLITLTFTTGKCSKIDLKLQRSPPELQKP